MFVDVPKRKCTMVVSRCSADLHAAQREDKVSCRINTEQSHRVVAGPYTMTPRVEEGAGEHKDLREPALVVGLGGGGLPVYLRHNTTLEILAVELDPAIVEIATEWFGFQSDEQLKVGAMSFKCRAVICRGSHASASSCKEKSAGNLV